MFERQQPPEQVASAGLPQSDCCEHSKHPGDEHSSVLVVARLTQSGMQASVQN